MSSETMERWPGYDEQSWQQRFAELDKRYAAMLQRSMEAVVGSLSMPVPTRDGEVGRLREAIGGEVERLIGADSSWAIGIRDRLRAALATQAEEA